MRGPATPDALQDAARDHRLERGCEDADQAPGHEQDEPGMNRGLAPDAIGERAEEHLAEPQPQEQRGDDILDVVRTRDPEVVADRGQRGQHRVGRERDQRHQEGDEGNELAGTKDGPGGRSTHSRSPGVVEAPVDFRPSGLGHSRAGPVSEDTGA